MATPTVVIPENMLSPLQELVREFPPELVQKVKNIVDEEKKKEIDLLAQTIRAENKETIDKAIEDMRKNLKPPTQEELQQFLEQELLEFKIKIPGRKGGAEEREFVIRELPQKVEKKMVRVLKERLVPIAQEVSALTMNFLEGDSAKKIVDLMNACEPVLDALTELSVVVLNPYGDNEEINVEWVQSHLTTQKIFAVVMAQFEANRLRDFFLQLSRGMRSLS